MLPKIQAFIWGLAGVLVAAAIIWGAGTLVKHSNALAAQAETNVTIHDTLKELREGQQQLREGQTEIMLYLSSKD